MNEQRIDEIDTEHRADETDTADDGLVVEDLIEEVSIDGMCGVY